MARKTPQLTLTVGDHARLKTRESNQHPSYRYDAAEVATYRESVDGIILAIREVRTGKLVSSTKSALDKYVVELIYNRTFNSRLASMRNAPRGVDDPTATSGWKRLRATLRQAADKGEFYSTAMPNLLTDNPLSTLLDGWKVVKVWSREMESLEKPEAPPESPVE